MPCIHVADSVPSTKKLLPFKDAIAPNWYEVGAMLLDETQEQRLKVIKATHGNDAKKCCMDMFQYWMDSRQATWHHLVSALRSPGVDLVKVAADIERNITGKLVIYVHIVLNPISN